MGYDSSVGQLSLTKMRVCPIRGINEMKSMSLCLGILGMIILLTAEVITKIVILILAEIKGMDK